MMDRIVVTAADIEKLLAWRDEHSDLVRSMPLLCSIWRTVCTGERPI